jgi:hypothetical protein
MAKPKIIISLLTDADTKDIHFCEEFLGRLLAINYLAPEFVGNSEPINTRIAVASDALPCWTRSPFLWRRKHKFVSQGSVHHTGGYGSGAIILDAMYDQSFDWKAIFELLIQCANAHYGYLHLATDYERSHSLLDPIDAYNFFLGAFAKKVENGFMDLGWANYFGARWIDGICCDDISDICGNMGNGYLITLTENIGDVYRNYEAFEGKRQIAKEAFRRGFFRPTSKFPGQAVPRNV